MDTIVTAIITALMDIANLAQRERERRRVNGVIRHTGHKITAPQVGTETVMPLTGDALKTAAKGHLRKQVAKSLLEGVPAEPENKPARKGKKGKSTGKSTGSTAKGKEVHRTATEWNKAFDGAFRTAPEGYRRAAARRAHGLVKHRGQSVRSAVSNAVKAAQEAQSAGLPHGHLMPLGK